MQIRTLIAAGGGTGIIAILVTAAAMYLTYTDISYVYDRNALSSQIQEASSELSILTGEYLLYHGERPKDQWLTKHASLGVLLSTYGDTSKANIEIIELKRLESQYIEVKEVFMRLIALNVPENSTNRTEFNTRRALEARLTTQLLTSLHTMASHSSDMARQFTKRMEKTIVDLLKIIAITFIALLLLFIGAWALVTRRIALPVTILRSDIDTISAGDLDHRAIKVHRDEFGSVAESINAMAKNLKETLVSRDALKVEVGQRQKAEAALRESEAGLTKAQRIGHLGNWSWNFENNEITWSDEVYRIFGLKPQEVKITSDIFLDAVHSDDREVIDQAVNATLNGDHPYSINHRIIRPDGTERIVHERGEMQIDDSGKPVRMDGMVQDITKRHQAETQLKETLSTLAKTNEELQQFTYSVSHDLRAPLRTISGFSQALIEDYGDKLKGDAHDYLRYLYDGAIEMGSLIDDLLALSRITNQEIIMSDLDLSSIAIEVADNLKKSESGRSAEFVIQPNILVFADTRLLRVVMENLLGNAFKFSRKEPTARIEFGACHKDGKIACHVRDNGVGFDMAYVDKLFSPFQRLNQKADFEGTGIGLSTVKRIINHHGGRTWAEGAVDEGATFYFELSMNRERS